MRFMRILEVLLLKNNNDKVLGLLGLATKAGKVLSGTDMVLDGIKRHKVKLVIIAEDASEKTYSNFEYECLSRSIQFERYGKIEDLSNAIGKVNRAVIAISDINLAEAIIKVIHGGEEFGKNKNS